MKKVYVDTVETNGAIWYNQLVTFLCEKFLVPLVNNQNELIDKVNDLTKKLEKLKEARK